MLVLQAYCIVNSSKSFWGI